MYTSYLSAQGFTVQLSFGNKMWVWKLTFPTTTAWIPKMAMKTGCEDWTG